MSATADTLPNSANWYPEHIPWYPTHKVRILFLKDGSIDKPENTMNTINNGAITYLNEVYKKSATSLMAESVGYGVITSQLKNIQLAKYDKEIIDLKEKHKADIVYIWSDTIASSASCGTSIISKSNEFAYATGALKKPCQPYSTFAHEVGHTFGLMHTSAAVESAHKKNELLWVKLSDAGYGTSSFTTQMAYPNIDGGPRLGIYSNPGLHTCKGAPCGTRDTANAAKNIQDNIEKRFSHNKITPNHEPTLKLYGDEFKSSGQILELYSSQGDLNDFGWALIPRNFEIPHEMTSVRFYTEKNYQGEEYIPKGSTLIPATHDIEAFKQKMQSVKITEGGRRFFIFKDPYQSGGQMEIATSQPSLGDFNAKMSSFTLPRGWRVRFYSEENYQGSHWTVDSMESRWGMNQTDSISSYNDKIRSIEILNRPYYK